MVTVTVKLPPTLNARISAEARKKRVSKSALIRDSLQKQFANGKSRRKPTVGDLAGHLIARPSLYERTRHLAGSLKGLPRDLSTNKKYMEGFGAS